ncbi:NACHT domain-containing protein [Streptomyces mesophilus]|uniref:NACHT domain-containing protein n=1 Tax=Streptomyces mesophilus TaxID=1775132 RepID=UPI001F2635C3|nr:NACHT domain-containing protein [Streptomyces mesophilus]
MQGLDVALARLAGTVVSTVAKSLLSRPPGAGLTGAPVRRRPLPGQRPGTADTARLTTVLAGRLSAAHPGLPAHERLAAVDAVRDTFTAAGPIDLDRVFAARLDPELLRAELPRVDASLSDPAQALFEELLRVCCVHAVEQLSADPSFAARAAVEQTRQLGRTKDLVEELRGPRPEAVALAFEQRYADFVAGTHGRLELFGLTLGGPERQQWPLDTAYISLSVSSEDPSIALQEGLGAPRATASKIRTEQALAASGRILLRGPAGSGKSTLVQWLALNAARRTFAPELADWNRCVPFVLRLRSFTASGTLPMPEEFLKAAGVPLHGSAPASWVAELLTSGRALVLVDGVDEVPLRLRKHTEQWLRSLVAAFPLARYVVTARPSAIPEDWLADLDFTPHELLPMERDDIRSFVAHWHTSAREACPADREQLDTYESGLITALTMRRDLGRMATNPLMCALLCALNRDRRMQLPRARKELYDAALEMLLVRRDAEREISSVEGVLLNREEQTVLLQRLAYWMIRNGQQEAPRSEVVEMIDGWLEAMPQVRAQGDARRVCAHLLIRSGLLREPVPGSVAFVHRTFQDYLGAKAAVEARDFGALVRNAHDDTWDDVVRMAVGHARVEERARLLRGLLKRASQVKRHRHRLVLLAAASLEHAPELDPAVRAEVEDRTAELLPPRSDEEAKQLADKAGKLVVELLPGPSPELDEQSAAAVVRTARLVGGDAALSVIERFKEDTRFDVQQEIGMGWSHFDTQDYVDVVLSRMSSSNAHLYVTSPAQTSALTQLRHLRQVALDGDQGLPPQLAHLDQLESLTVYRNSTLSDLRPLRDLPRLRRLNLSQCPSVHDLSALAGSALDNLHLTDLPPDLSLDPLREMRDLTRLGLNYPVPLRRVGDLETGEQLTALGLFANSPHISLRGLDRWPRLTWLSLAGSGQVTEFTSGYAPPDLQTLQILDSLIDPAHVGRHQNLTDLWLLRCEIRGGLEPLRELPQLRRLRFAGCTAFDGDPLDLGPLAGLDELKITVEDDTPVRGNQEIPEDRLVRSRTMQAYLI